MQQRRPMVSRAGSAPPTRIDGSDRRDGRLGRRRRDQRPKGVAQRARTRGAAAAMSSAMMSRWTCRGAPGAGDRGPRGRRRAGRPARTPDYWRAVDPRWGRSRQGSDPESSPSRYRMRTNRVRSCSPSWWLSGASSSASGRSLAAIASRRRVWPACVSSRSYPPSAC